MKAKKIQCIMLIILVIALSSCTYYSGVADSTVATLAFANASEKSTLALADGKMIYQTLENPTYFFALDIEHKTEVELGSVPNFILNGYSLVDDSSKLYTYITVSDDDGKAKNVLYEIDYSNNTMNPLIFNQDYAPIIYVYITPRGILQLKTPSSNLHKTYFELYDPQTGDSSVMLVAQENETYIIASVNRQSLFVFVALKMPDGSNEFVIEEYDIETYSLINTIELENVHSYILKARIGKMEVLGNYIYMLNYSNKGIICEITDNAVVPVLEREDLVYVWNKQYEVLSPETLFFIRNTDECFTFNIETGEIKQIYTRLQSGYVIGSIFADGDDILLRTRTISDNKLVKEKEILYLYKYYDYVTR